MSLKIADYEVSKVIAESENSIVYQARDRDREVVLKVFRRDYPTPQDLSRYQNEYELVRSLNIQGVIQAYEMIPHQRGRSPATIVFESFGGMSLKHILAARQNQPFSGAEFLNIAIEITQILGELHSQQIIHKDINPTNILYNPDTEKIKIIDFGIATRNLRQAPKRSQVGILEGTLTYIAPEQTGRMNHSLDSRSDLYSLGITFYELLTGQPPFSGTTPTELIHAHIAQQPPPPQRQNPEIPPPLAGIILKLLAKNPEDRYQSAWGLQFDLIICQMQLEATGEISDLTPGENDVCEQFQLSQKIYGRDVIIEAVLARLTLAINQRSPQLLLISGATGIGKTAFGKALEQAITAYQDGATSPQFIAGKFTSQGRAFAYGMFKSMIADWLQQLRWETHPTGQQRCQKLVQRLGSRVNALSQIFPELADSFSALPSTPLETRRSPTFEIEDLLPILGEVLTSPQQPLVVFLDNLQWADRPTIEMIQRWLYRPQTQPQFVLLVGTYCPEEVQPHSPFSQWSVADSKAGKMVLPPLTLADITQWLVESFRGSPDSIQPLAAQVQQKTQGFPFFVKQFLKRLVQDGLLFFDRNTLSWQWEIESIKREDLTENAVELILAELNQLSPTTQQLLQQAACLGTEFNLTALAALSNRETADLEGYLQEAIALSVIIPVSNGETLTYAFSHDRIQQSLYDGFDPHYALSLHYQIGQRLLQEWQQQPPEAQPAVESVLEHLNLVLDRLTPAERYAVARLNYQAAQTARSTQADDLALTYYQAGLNLLDRSSWESEYKFTWTLHFEAWEIAQMRREEALATQLYTQLCDRARSPQEQATVYIQQIQHLTASEQPQQALTLGDRALALLHLTLPETTSLDLSPLNYQALIAFSPITQPPFPDEYLALQYQLLSHLLLAASDAQPQQVALILAKMQQICEESSTVLGCAVNQHQSLRSDRLRAMFETNLNGGNRNYSRYTLLAYCAASVLSGQPLGQVIPALTSAIEAAEQQGIATKGARYWLHLAEQLHAQQPAPAFQDLQSQAPLSVQFSYHFTRGLWYYFTDNADLARIHWQQADQIRQQGLVFPEDHQLSFYQALAEFALYPNALPVQQAHIRSTLYRFTAEVERLAVLYPDEFSHRYDLIVAEQGRLSDRPWDAVQAYDRAIEQAKEGGFLHEEAQSCELAAQFYREQGIKRSAQLYERDCYYALQYWQGWAKLSRPERDRPPHRAIPYQIQNPETLSAAALAQTASGTYNSPTLDFEAALEASGAIASEIILERLLGKLMEILIENVGAQRGHLLMNHDNRWQIEASSIIQGAVTVSEPIEQCVSLKVVEYVAQTQKALVCDEATQDLKDFNDPYLQQHQPRSLLCAPLINQGHLEGIIYLENNLANGAFTAERLELTRFLAAQAAIAIANARLYATTKEGENRLNQIINAMPVGVFVIDRPAQAPYINACGRELLVGNSNIPPETLVRDNPALNHLVMQALQGQSIHTDTIELQYTDSPLPLEAWGTPIYDREGNVQYAILTFSDIRDRKQSEKLIADYNRTLETQVRERTEALGQSEAQNRALLAAIPDLLFRINKDGTYVGYVSTRKAFDLLPPGYDPVGCHISEYLPPDVAQRQLNVIDQVLTHKETCIYEQSFEQDGVTVYEEVRVVQSGENEVLFMVRDISDRKRAEEALRLSEEKFSKAFRSSPSSITITSLDDGKHLEANETFCQMIGYSVEEIIGRTAVDLNLWVNSEDRHNLFMALQNNNVIRNYEFAFKTKSGDVRNALLSAERININGQACLLSLSNDISDRVQAEAALRQKNQELELALDQLQTAQTELIQAEKMAVLGQLIAGVAHEINTPLGAIRAAASNTAQALQESLSQLPDLVQRLSPTQQQQFFDLIQKSVSNQKKLTAREQRTAKRSLAKVLKTANIESSRRFADTLIDMGIYDNIEPHLALFQTAASDWILQLAYNLTRLQRNSRTILTAIERAAKVVFALKTYAHQSSSDRKEVAQVTHSIETVLELYYNQLKKGVEVNRDYQEVPPIPCYPDELMQVWTNLIHNALQAMNYQGTLDIRVFPEGNDLAVAISDSGCGISDELKAKIFEPFFTTKAAGEGSGLGLDIVHKIVKKHEGRIDLTSQPGQTTFTVWLPINDTDSPSILPESPTT